MIKKILAGLIILFAAVAAHATGTGYKVSALKNNLVLREIIVESHDELDGTIAALCKKFPEVERIEIDMGTGEKISIRVVGKSMSFKKVEGLTL